MLILLTDHLTRLYTGFNVFSYLTMRAILSALTALVKKWKSGEGWKPGATSSRQLDICADDLATLLRETGA